MWCITVARRPFLINVITKIAGLNRSVGNNVYRRNPKIRCAMLKVYNRNILKFITIYKNNEKLKTKT